jgi:hypothetical protein
MKNTLLCLSVIALAAFSASFKSADDSCKPYFPVKQGAQIERRSYNDKGKQTGRTVQTILSSNATGSILTLSVKSTHFDDKDKQTNECTFDAKCENGIFYLNMASGAEPQSRPNTTTTVTGDFLEFPSNLSPGMTLKGGTMTINMVSTDPNFVKLGMGNFTVTNTSSNIKVISDTSITTPAGTFKCVKITSDQTTKTPLSSTVFHVVDYYAQNIGKVRSETYTDKGKSYGYSVISSISGN